MRSFALLFLALAALTVIPACKKKPREYTASEKAQAANYVSEAQFAMQIREFARAEELFQKATTIRDDFPEYWVALGMARRRQDNVKGARQAYEKALGLHTERYQSDKRPEELVQQAWVTALLGKTDAALKLLQEGSKVHPENETLRKMSTPQGLPRTFQTSQFKDLAL
jgi:tetratricopeptide (TPR) repeat protein